MDMMRALVVAVLGLLLGASWAYAQDLSRYRVYTLGSSLDAVVAASGARPTEARTLHKRPAMIQEIEWRASYLRPATDPVDPVRGIAFTFYDDALYQLVVSYDRDRTEGLTEADIVESISATYGVPVLRSARAPMQASAGPAAWAALPDTTVVARWEDASSALTLVRGDYSPAYQLVVASKVLSAKAGSAIAEAIRLDTAEAPRRESERLEREATDAGNALEKARTTNKAAFRP